MFVSIVIILLGTSTVVFNPGSSKSPPRTTRVDDIIGGDRTCGVSQGFGTYVTCSDGTTCTVSEGFGGDYLKCSDGLQCTTTHGFNNTDYTTCNNGRKCTTFNGFSGPHTTCAHD
jgi:hypothetical protein